MSAERGRSERNGKRETCSSWSESSPDGELPSAYAAAITVEARRDLPERSRGVFIFIFGSERARAIHILDSKATAAAKEGVEPWRAQVGVAEMRRDGRE